MENILIADSGSSTTGWCLMGKRKKIFVQTQGISPYFMNGDQIADILRKELLPSLGKSVLLRFFSTEQDVQIPKMSK